MLEKNINPEMIRQDMKKIRYRTGNIADYKGDCIVVPSWSDLLPTEKERVARAINDKVKSLGLEPKMFERETIWGGKETHRVQLYSAHYFSDSQLPDVRGYILAVPYVDMLELEQDMPADLKSIQTTKNVMMEAHKHEVRTIAFPPYLTGDHAASIEDAIGGMLTSISKHYGKAGMPIDTTIYFRREDKLKEALVISERMNLEIIVE